MASKLVGMSGNIDGSATQCPLCQFPVNSSDELQLHYLTSCSGYDVSHEQPRSKLGNNSRVGDVAMDTRGSGMGIGDGDGGGSVRGGGSDVGIGRMHSGEREHSAAAAAAAPPHDCSVQFMWQPLTQISYPSVTLLASFQRGSIELNMDPEGGHYASEFVNIPKGSYEGQLVVGDSFIHPVKEFKVHKDDDIIVLQFIIERDYSGYNMKTNPSYNPSTSTTITVRHPPSVSYSNPMYGSHDDIDRTLDHRTTNKTSLSEGGGTSRDYNITGTNTYKDYLTNNDDPGSFRGSNRRYTYPRIVAAMDAVASGGGGSGGGGDGGDGGGDGGEGKHETRTSHELAHDYSTPKPTVPSSWSTGPSSYSESGSHRDQEQERGGGNGGGSVLNLKQQLEEITRERDTMRNNQERVNATWESRVKRLEAQLQHAERVGASPPEASSSDAHLATNNIPSTRKEIDELRDHNAALEVQLREYQESIEEQDKLMRTISSSNEAKQLLDLTKRQQLEHAESFSEMKEKIENAMKLHDRCIKVSQTNIDLAGDLEEYRTQTKRLLQEMKQKDEETLRLRESLSERSNDRIALELETWKEKCQGWRGEVERLMPLEQEVEKLRGENEELSQEITLMVEEGEQNGRGRGMNYDAMMERMTKLQDTRVQMEEELSVLREERTSLLRETAALREGSQFQLYTDLKASYETALDEFQNVKSELVEKEKMNIEFRGANYELQQKLIEAINPDKLKSIQERLDRYKKERDMARADLEDREAKLALAEVERQSAQDALSDVSNRENEILQRRLDSSERELAKMKVDSQKYELRMRSYREERNMAREEIKSLRQQLRHNQSLIPSEPPTLSGQVDEVTEPPSLHSPNNEHQHFGSPILEYTPDNYLTTREQFQHYHRETDSPAMEDHTTAAATATATTSTSTSCNTASNLRSYHLTGRSSETSSGQPKDSCNYSVVQVKTKDELVTMGIQRPMILPNVKTRPPIIVKRGDEYETGTLMYLGKSNANGKEFAGVTLDNKIEKTSSFSSSTYMYDGTHKDGKRYFKCAIGFGLYVPLSRIYIEVETATV